MGRKRSRRIGERSMTTRGINRATVLGYLGKDPRITTTVNGGLRAHISIATSETWQNENDGNGRTHRLASD